MSFPIFRNEEWIGVGLDKFGNGGIFANRLSPLYQFVTLNPLKRGATRADSNVSEFRNFLIEMDELSLEEQDALMAKLQVPYFTKVFSGKKSYHYIISLKVGIPTELEWRAYAKAILKAIPGADPSTCNPSRFTRNPGHVRPDTGLVQALKQQLSPITIEELQNWLLTRGQDWRPKPRVIKSTDIAAALRPYNSFTSRFLTQGAKPGEYHNQAIRAACDMARCGWTRDAILDKISKVWPWDAEQDEDLQKVIDYAIAKSEE